tara:strand:+ start:259 stop:492 length:234 start_codon:yes stop_codon:yes gene_type:complete
LYTGLVIIGKLRKPSTSSMPTDESPESLKPASPYVYVDLRVLKEVYRKKPIGVSPQGWVNLLLQRAIALEPDPLPRD